MQSSVASIHTPIASRPVRVTIVGYGSAGRVFHAPLVSAVPGLALHSFVSSKPDAVRADWPQVAVVAQAAQALTQCQTLLYELPKVVAGNIALAGELEALKLSVVKDVVQS